MLQWITDLTYRIESLAAELGAVYKVASRYYQDVIEKESIMASITQDDHILCIGGGVCPFSAILFHQATGAKVTAIDSNAECIPIARQVIDGLGIGDEVRVICQEGSEAADLTQYSVIHLALQITPMDEVFSQVAKQAADGTRILIRRPKKSIDGAYSELPSPLLERCPYVEYKQAGNIGSTLMYIKQPSLQSRATA